MFVIELLQIVVYRIGIDIIFDSLLINVQLLDRVENYWMRSELKQSTRINRTSDYRYSLRLEQVNNIIRSLDRTHCK